MEKEDQHLRRIPERRAPAEPGRRLRWADGPSQSRHSESNHEGQFKFQPDPKRWTTNKPYQYPIPKDASPWDECFDLVLKFDEEMCRGWREEVDTLLVFAGLFSAAVTAFTIESYQWLQEDPLSIQTQLLQSIANQLTNKTNDAQSPTIAIFFPSPSSIRINILWFTSLTLSLSSVIIGILCKQWLREYQRYEGLSAKDSFPIRQLRYEGLIAWQVPKILTSLPLILQAALVLFLAGLLDLLWAINPQVGSSITVLVGIIMIFLIGTTILPGFQVSALWTSHDKEKWAQCAFKSPQSWAFHMLVTRAVLLFSILKQYIFHGRAVNYLQLQLNFWHSRDINWVKFDQRWQQRANYMQQGIGWFHQTFAKGNGNLHAIRNVFHCLDSLETGVSAACVSQIIADNWDPLIPLVGLIQPTLKSFQDPALPYSDVPPEFAHEMVLASYLVVHHRANASISLQCMERCIRMLNCLPPSQNLDTTILEIINIVLPSPEVPTEFGKQLTMALGRLFTSETISQSHLPTLWSILKHIQRKDAGLPLQCLFSEMESWLGRIQSSPYIQLIDKQMILRSCSNGISDLVKIQRVHLDVGISIAASLSESGGMEASAHLYSFVMLLDQYMESLGGAALILSLWGAEGWNLMKKDLMKTMDDPSFDTKSVP